MLAIKISLSLSILNISFGKKNKIFYKISNCWFQTEINQHPLQMNEFSKKWTITEVYQNLSPHDIYLNKAKSLPLVNREHKIDIYDIN